MLLLLRAYCCEQLLQGTSLLMFSVGIEKQYRAVMGQCPARSLLGSYFFILPSICCHDYSPFLLQFQVHEYTVKEARSCYLLHHDNNKTFVTRIWSSISRQSSAADTK